MKLLITSIKSLLPVVLLAVGVAGMGNMVATRPKPKTKAPEVEPPLVRTVEVRKQSVRLTVKTQGTVMARTEGSLVSEASGRVVEVASSFAAGGFFKAGDVLVKIDPRDYEFAVVRSRAQVARAESLLEREKAEAEVAAREWRSLGTGEASPLALRKPQLAEAEANLAAARAELEAAELALERTVVRAPYVGRVREKRVDVGQYVTRGAPVAEIYAVDYAEVRLPLSDEQLAKLDLTSVLRNGSDAEGGPKVILRARFAGEEYTWTGRIVRTEGHIDPRSRMITVVARVSDPYGRKSTNSRPPLAVGLFVTAEIEGRLLEDAAVLPRAALYAGGRVMVIEGCDTARLRSVAVQLTNSDAVIVHGGLADGELVCVSMLEVEDDGTKVRPVPDGAAVAAVTQNREVIP